MDPAQNMEKKELVVPPHLLNDPVVVAGKYYGII